MSINLVISEICCNFKELIYKQSQTKIVMITEDKVTEIFCMADDFCKFFHAMTAKYGSSGFWSDKVFYLCLEFEVMSHGGTERTEDY